MTKLLIVWIIVGMLAAWRANGVELDHVAAHVGMSYLLDDVAYRLLWRSPSPVARHVMAACLALGIGLGYKLYENAPFRDIITPMERNVIGVGLATAVHIAF